MGAARAADAGAGSLVVLSRKTPERLAIAVASIGRRLAAADEAETPRVCRRTALADRAGKHRLVVVAESRDALLARLRACVEGTKLPGIFTGSVTGERPRVAFLFSGQGADYEGMGEGLRDAFPVFRRAVDRLAALQAVALRDSGPHASATARMQRAQLSTFVLQHALARLLASLGITPGAVLGHSLGEYAAAVTAGVLSVGDGLSLVAERARLLASLPGDSGMAVLMGIDESQARHAIGARDRSVSIAAINGPTTLVLSGEAGALAQVLGAIESDHRDVLVRRLPIDAPAHSVLVEPVLPRMRAAAARFSYGRAKVPFVSNVTGTFAGAADVGTPEYWTQHLRHTVRFADGVLALHRSGYRVFVEIGPHVNATSMGALCVPRGAATWIPLLYRQDPAGEAHCLREALGRLFVAGQRPDWSRLWSR